MNTPKRITASLPKELAIAIQQHAADLNLTPSNFVALSTQSIIDMMDSKASPHTPDLVQQYHVLRKNSALKSQLQKHKH